MTTTKAYKQIDDLLFEEWAGVPAKTWKALAEHEAEALTRAQTEYGIAGPSGRRIIDYWEELQSPTPRAAGNRKPRPDRLPRIARQEDTKEALVELVQHAMADPGIRPNDLTVLTALADNGIGRTSIEIEASRDWLVEVTGLSVESVRWATGRLERLGYVKRITKAEVTRQWLKSYLARHPKEGRPPTLYRLSTNLPDWTSVPTGPPLLGGLAELLAAR